MGELQLNWYNENEPYAAAWLGNLIREGIIPDGEVCEQDVRTVGPEEVRGFRQCHFFAGIGGWPLALRLAGWPEDREVWTGSCPCQPFSVAGKGAGADDPRHLWPAWLALVAERRPPTIFGEQVASRLGREWLAGVFADLEALGYAIGAADLCAASVGAPHIRQRLWWVADAARIKTRPSESKNCLRQTSNRWKDAVPQAGGRCCELHRRVRSCPPGVRLVAHGFSVEVAQSCPYGNAIVPQVAATFIRAFMRAE